jgi:predicted alpha/beta hydrolase
VAQIYIGADTLLALSISDDRGFAPSGTVLTLLQKFINAKTQHVEIAATEGHRGKIGHFGFFKSQNATLWPYVSQWLDSVLVSNESADQR